MGAVDLGRSWFEVDVFSLRIHCIYISDHSFVVSVWRYDFVPRVSSGMAQAFVISYSVKSIFIRVVVTCTVRIMLRIMLRRAIAL